MIAPLLSRAELLLVLLTHAAWQAGLLALVVLAIAWLLRGRLDPRWRFALWLVVFARLAMPILPAASWSLFGLFKVDRAAPSSVALEPNAAASAFEEPAPPALAAPGDFPFGPPAEPPE